MLLEWYAVSKRDLPWRENQDPYRIWLSEIMLQQTRVEAVKEYYTRFLHALPTVSSLADAPEEVLLKLWEGLGYYSRVRNMQKAAVTVMNEYGGHLPADHDALLKLSGIGPYTAAAIASIAFDIPKAAVDGNVLRIYTRLGANGKDIADPAFKKEVAQALDAVIPKDAPGAFNQAMMDLGATVCLPNGAPLCTSCPLSHLCLACHDGTQTSYPVKSKSKARTIEKMTVFLIRHDDTIILRKRSEKGLLAGMYEPLHAPGWMDEDEALTFIKELNLDPLHIERIEDAKHIFTHKEWHMIAYEVKVGFPAPEKAHHLIYATPGQISSTYPLPSAFAAYRARMGMRRRNTKNN